MPIAPTEAPREPKTVFASGRPQEVLLKRSMLLTLCTFLRRTATWSGRDRGSRVRFRGASYLKITTEGITSAAPVNMKRTTIPVVALEIM
jgi:hypothetical protein